MQDILITIMYCGIGIVLMSLGTFLVDLVIPCHFPTEIKNRNVAVGYITAGVSIGIGIILKSAIISPEVVGESITILQGITGTIIYFLVGIGACILGYLAMLTMNKKYNLNKEIADGNPAAGLMIMGLFIGLSIVISGAIY